MGVGRARRDSRRLRLLDRLGRARSPTARSAVEPVRCRKRRRPCERRRGRCPLPRLAAGDGRSPRHAVELLGAHRRAVRSHDPARARGLRLRRVVRTGSRSRDCRRSRELVTAPPGRDVIRVVVTQPRPWLLSAHPVVLVSAVDTVSGTVQLPEGVAIDLGGVGKGFAGRPRRAGLDRTRRAAVRASASAVTSARAGRVRRTGTGTIDVEHPFDPSRRSSRTDSRTPRS